MGLEQTTIRDAILQCQTVLGIEFGSTRIKAVLIDANHQPIASGGHDWENRFENNIWTYHLEDVWSGVQDCFHNLNQDVFEKYGLQLTSVGAIGFSAMMHGYLAFDETDELLVPFRTWRNTITASASEELSQLFNFSIPQRWSIAHLYQAILNGEPHIKKIRTLTTLAGYVHWKLTGRKVLGVGEASGMFPINSSTESFDPSLLELFNQRIEKTGLPWTLQKILPEVLPAGEPAGTLTEEGARLLDPTGSLKAGIPLCPPEGDAGTGMVATNSVAARTGNVSAGTSIFAMIVLEKPLSKVYPEIDMVTTPSGKPVAMVHCNNCTSDLNAWVGLFHEFADLVGMKIDQSALFEKMFTQALHGDADCDGLLTVNYLSGEHITHFEEGRPLFVRQPDSRFNLANFMRTHLFSTVASLKIGLNILFDQEHVKVDRILGHGGFFKTRSVGQKVMAAVMGAPVSVMQNAGEGGAWGIALLADFMLTRAAGETLETYLSDRVFSKIEGSTITPDPRDIEGFNLYMARYLSGLNVERAAVDSLRKNNG